MQSKTTLKRIGGLLQKSLMILGLFCFFVGKINAQVFTNGNLSTGATTTTGDPAPGGYTWSEVQTGNANAGYAASVTNGFTVADDFTVTCGTWDLTKFTCYSYSTGYTGTTSPVIDLRLQIFDVDPAVGTPVPLFGNLTTNRLTSSTDANMYRIFTGAALTNRKIWKNEATISISLPPGHYWVEWQVDVDPTLTSNFSPASTVAGTVTQPGNNAQQHDIGGALWAPILDGPAAADPQDMPFRLDYNTTVCAGTPAPGNTISTASTICPATLFTLSPQNGTCGSGVTYQWQSSLDGINFTDIAGATNATFSTAQNVPTYYQVVVSCSGTPGPVDSVFVDITPAGQCYCIPPSSDCTDGDIITNVTLNTLDNTSDCEVDGFINYGADPTVTIPDIVQGIANPISVTAGGGVYDETVAVWIDYDHSGTFDASEYTFIGGTTGGTLTENINVPASAPLGQARMRVRVQFFDTFGAGDACTVASLGFGETEDYLVNIVPCVQGVFDAQPANVSTSCGNDVAIGTVVTGTYIAYQWQQKVGAGPWTNVLNTAPFSGANSDTLRIAAAPASLDGNQYRVLISGGCTAVDFSDAVTLTVTPLVIEVNPTSYNSCDPIPTATPVALTITTVPGGSVSTTNTYYSGVINLLVPDIGPDLTGVTNSITVPPLPAGAIVTGASVTINANHAYAGDLIIGLKAPNNNVLSLDYALGATGGPGATAVGFVNTEISSAGTDALVDGLEPWTGLFAADAFPDPGPGFFPVAPTSLTDATVPPSPIVTTWNALFSVPDGVWTLGLYDYSPPDEGTLVDWTLKITYSIQASAPYEGVWSPTTDLFLDAAGTIPYAGTEESTVYAAPSVTTNYSVVVTTPSCTSDPVVVPVIIGASLGTFIDQPRDTAVCAGSVVTFTADASPSGTPVTYQWQISSDGGATYSNVPGGTSATLTTAASVDGALYHLVISSATCPGSITSDAATLSVTAPQSVEITALPYTNIYPGIRTQLTAVTTPVSTHDVYQWYYNGVAVAGANASTFEVNFGTTGIGEFSVDVTDTSSLCTDAINASITIRDSINNTLFIWPNPNNGHFTVAFNNGLNDIISKPPFLGVFDSKGARLSAKSYKVLSAYDRMEVDMSSVANGIYIVVLYDNSGSMLKTGRVVIRK